MRGLCSLLGEARGTVKGTPDDRGSKTTDFEFVMDRVSGERLDSPRASRRRRVWARLKREDEWAVVGSHPCTGFLVVNDDDQCHRINQVSRRCRMTDVPNSCLDLRSVCTSGKRNGNDASRTNCRRSSAWKEFLQIHVMFAC